MIRLTLVDDHEIFRKGLEGLLKSRDHFDVIKSLGSANELLENLPLSNTDVLLLDLQLPDMEPDVLLKKIRIKQPDLKVLYLTLVRGNRYFNRLKPMNIQGYLLKDSPVEILSEAIESVAQGNEYFTDRYQTEHLNTVTTPENKMKELLSKRELEVLKLVAQEYSSAQIAEQLFLSVSTVDSHRKNIMIKLGVENIVGLIKVAVQNGLI